MAVNNELTPTVESVMNQTENKSADVRFTVNGITFRAEADFLRGGKSTMTNQEMLDYSRDAIDGSVLDDLLIRSHLLPENLRGYFLITGRRRRRVGHSDSILYLEWTVLKGWRQCWSIDGDDFIKNTLVLRRVV